MSRTLFLTFEGRTLSMREWARERGLTYACLQTRLRYMSLEEALARPISNRGRPKKGERELIEVMINTIRQYFDRRICPVRAVIYAPKRSSVTSSGPTTDR